MPCGPMSMMNAFILDKEGVEKTRESVNVKSQLFLTICENYN